MKPNQRLARLGCALFLLVSLALGVGALLPHAAFSAEGREPSPFPALRTETGGLNAAFSSEFDRWLTDRVPFRGAILSAVSHVRERLFATGSEQVLVGRHGFLFFSDTVADYCGESDMTEAELTAAADALAALSEYAAAHGARLLVAVAPNKNTIYPDEMPAAYRRLHDAAHETNLDRLTAALDARGVASVDLRPILSDAETRLYHRRDTHWNAAGAARAADAILTAAGVPHEAYAALPVAEGAPFAGDLDGMLYPGEERTEPDLVPALDLSRAFAYTSAFTSPMDMTITTRARGETTLLVFRDSFGSALIPYLSAAALDARYERAVPYRIDLLERYPASLVIVEIAERNIPALTAAADRLAASDGT